MNAEPEKYQLNPGPNYFIIRFRGSPESWIFVIEAPTAIIARETAARELGCGPGELKIVWLPKGLWKCVEAKNGK